MQLDNGFQAYYVYILTNKAKTVLYTGVTNNLKIRLQQHAENIDCSNFSFTSDYQVHICCTSKNLLEFNKS